MTTLARSGVPDCIGRQWYFVRVHDAVQTCISHTEALIDKKESAAEEGNCSATMHINASPGQSGSVRNDSPYCTGSLRQDTWSADGSETSRPLLSNAPSK